MKRILFSLLIALLLVSQSQNLPTNCPSGDLVYRKFDLLRSGAFDWTSRQKDVYYELTNTAGVYTLSGNRFKQDNSNINAPTYTINTFTTVGDSTWTIVSVSKQGNCLGVRQGTDLVTYNTASNAFTQVQKFSIKTFALPVITVGDDCKVINIQSTASNSVVSNQVYIASTLVQTFTQSAKFSSNLDFVLESKKIWTLSGSTYTGRDLTITQGRDIPVSIEYSKRTKGVIALTQDATNSDYVVYIFDSTKIQNTLGRVLSTTTISGVLTLTVLDDNTLIFFRDDAGLKLGVWLTSAASTLNIIDITVLTEYKALFKTSSFISGQTDTVVTYSSDNVLTYFKLSGTQLYFLSKLTSNIQTKLTDNLNNNAAGQIRAQIALVSSSAFLTCDPAPSIGADIVVPSDSSKTAVDILVDDTPVIIKDSSGKVGKCDDSCKVCTTTGACSSCALGFVLNGAACVSCNGCKLCNSLTPTICTQCFPPQILNTGTNLCQDAPTATDPNCLLFGSDKTCSKCKQGYSKIGTVCQKCTIDGCSSCSVSVDKCDASSTCSAGFVATTNTKDSSTYCFQCVSGCSRCTAAAVYQCTTCNAGFYSAVDSDTKYNLCYKCLPNCKNCTAADTCLGCDLYYTLSDDKKKCSPQCNQTCLTCDPSNSAKCLSCYAGATLSTNTNTCDSDLACNSTQTCISCASGFTISNSYCYKCTYTTSNCLSCTAAKLNTCAKCRTGFYIKSDATCASCNSRCISCVGENACTLCAARSYLVKVDSTYATGSCVACSGKCNTCQDTANFCTSCNADFYLAGSRCVSSKNNINLVFVLTALISQLASLDTNLCTWVVAIANSALAAGQTPLSVQDCVVTKLKTGSTQVTSIISTASAAAAQQAGAGLKTTLDRNPTINGYTVLSNSVTVNTGSTSSSSDNLGLILGITIPIGIILIIAIIIIIVKVNGRKDQSYKQKYEDGQQSQGKIQNDRDTDRV